MIPQWLTGLIKPVADVVGGAVTKSAERRIAIENAGYQARLAGWIDDYLIVLLTSPIAFIVCGGIASLFDAELAMNINFATGMVQERMTDLLGDTYGTLMIMAVIAGLGIGVSRKVADKVVERKMKQIRKGD